MKLVRKFSASLFPKTDQVVRTKPGEGLSKSQSMPNSTESTVRMPL